MIQKLDNIPFFSTLEDNLKEDLLSHANIYEYSEGQILFFEEDELEKIFYLIEGSIKFYKVDRFDNEVFLYKLYGPKLIFDLSKLSPSPIIRCFANAEFDMDGTVLAIDQQWFLDNTQSNTKLMQNVLQESFSMIAQLQCIINRDVVFDGTAKVAHFLVNDLESYNRLKKHEIAYMLHIQPETLSRIIQKFVRNDIITNEKNVITINDINALKEIYE